MQHEPDIESALRGRIVEEYSMFENLLSFDDAIAESSGRPRNLLLGNGFSIGGHENFAYRKLFEQSSMSDRLRAVFKELSTDNFEVVTRALRTSAKLSSAVELPEAAGKLASLANDARDVLIKTIVGLHPKRPSDITETKRSACKHFLGHFKTYFTLSYDLLFYWVNPRVSDGFGWEHGRIGDDLVWRPNRPSRLFFLHGALHLFDDNGVIKKRDFGQGGPLVDQVSDALQSDQHPPLVVTEGTDAEKRGVIEQHEYLRDAIEKLRALTGVLFIFGVGFDDSDKHIVEAIRDSKLDRIYVSVSAELDADQTDDVKRRTARLRPPNCAVPVVFYDRESARVWGGDGAPVR